MDFSKDFKSDAETREKGVWVDLPGTTDGTEILVRSEDYPPYRRAISRLVERNQGRFVRRQNQTGDPLEFEINRGKIIAEFLLLDWKGAHDKGVEIPFSREVAERYLTDPDYRDFYLSVSEALDRLTRTKVDWEADRKKVSAIASSQT